MRYLQAGSGRPLVLVHGLLGYSFSWRFALPSFSTIATTYAIDMPGAGFSERCSNLSADLRASAMRLLHFFDAVGINRCDLLGSSRGGAVSMLAAALSPDRVRSLILVSPVNPWSAHGRKISRVLSHPLLAGMAAWTVTSLRIIHPFILNRLFGDTGRIRPGTLQGYAAAAQVPGTGKHAVSILRTWNEDLDLLESMLPRIAEIPTLLIWGSLDRAVHPSSVKELQKRLRHSHTVMFEGAGHMPYEEVPDEFNRIVMEFLQQRPSAA